uniref:Uncharacterized protein n=1 Tax=viral metagenome TaxID=1070528 RepID=A0A6M3M7A8_9ZZZZ
MSGVRIGSVYYPRHVWNEMQRDAAPTPDEWPKTYFCKECGHKHWTHSKIGRNHLIPKRLRGSASQET